MVGDGKDRYVKFLSLLNDNSGVIFWTTGALLTAKGLSVVVRIHLERTFEEACARWKPSSTGNYICVNHVLLHFVSASSAILMGLVIASTFSQ